MQSKHKNIPIFIPHLGCPHDCVFCNQKKISGHGKFNPETVIPEIEEALSTMKDGEKPEIAYFGGSFTGIDRELMIRLLDIAEEYVKSGKVSGIRMSTRPDYINEEILDILGKYTVSAVELGIQSLSEEVLLLSEREHGVEDSVFACNLIKERGIPLVGQMMVGLPGSDIIGECETARGIVSLGCSAARVYPTVVFRDTKLCRMAADGKYIPLTNEDAVKRTKEVLKILVGAGVTILRIGLCSNEDIRNPDEVYAGATHPALGELVIGEVYYDIIREKISKSSGKYEGAKILVRVGKNAVSKAVGQKRHNILRLEEEFKPKGIAKIRVVGCDNMADYEVMIDKEQEERKFICT